MRAAIGLLAKPVVSGGGTVYTDDFNRANGAPGANWTTGGGWSINTNKLQRDTGGSDWIEWATALPSADHYVQAIVTQTHNEYVCMNVRCGGGLGSNRYQGFLSPDAGHSGDSRWTISKIVSGGYTGLFFGATEATFAEPFLLRMEAQGSNLRLYAGGVLKVSGTDSTHTTQTTTGLNCSHNFVTATYDDFETGTL